MRGTGAGLDRLAEAGWIGRDIADTLFEHYRKHRDIEHRLQMVRDAQTHSLPTDDAEFTRLAAMMDMDADALRHDLAARLEEVHALTEGFFAPDAGRVADEDWGSEITTRWPTYPALRSPRAVEVFKRLWPDVQVRLKDASRPDEALVEFDRFLAGLPAGVQLFSLFEANPQLSQLIVDIAATAPALAQYLSRNAGVFDAVIGGTFFDPWPEQAALEAELSAVLAGVGDYEAQLNAARRWVKERHFGIGVHHLRGLIGAQESGSRYASLAEAALSALWPVVVTEFSRKHGAPPGAGAVVMGMGSLGAGQLHALSDLDVIVIYDPEGVDASEGKRPLSTRPYYARLTQALVTAISAPMSDGRMYELDMRLRPSGRQGPVATSIGSFRAYQQDEAWTWEHLALTRARAVAGSVALGKEVEAFRCALLPEKGHGTRVAADVSDMRNRLAEAKPATGAWDAKDGPGRMQDIALFAQTCALRAGAPERGTEAQLLAGVANGGLDAADCEALRAASTLLWRVQAAGRLLSGGVFDPDAVGEGGRRFVLRETGFETMDALEDAMAEHAAVAAGTITAYLEDWA